MLFAFVPGCVSAFDLSMLRGMSKMDLSDLPQARGGSNENSEIPMALPSESVPFVGDFAILDSEYIAGPGDQFQLIYENTSIERQINPEGNIILAHVGTLHLGGLKLREAKRLLVEKLQTTHKKSECFANLSRPRTMKIFVTGAVNNPGSQQVSGIARLSEVISTARGFTSQAQRTEIRIITRDSVEKRVNLKRFLVDGDLGANPYLPQGAMIQVPFIDYAKPWVTFRRDTSNQTVQLDSGENVQSLLLRFYSFTTPPPFAEIIIREKNGKTQTLGPSEIVNYRPGPEAQLEILTQLHEVYVGGAVLRSGYQSYHSNFNMMQYISDAGVLTISKLPKKVHVVRANGEHEDVAILDGTLHPGDMVYVDQNAEQRFITYTPIILSLASLALAFLGYLSINNTGK